MSASTRIPPIAQPFVSDQAKRTLDLVRTLYPGPKPAEPPRATPSVYFPYLYTDDLF
jgi:hypothetical protein